MTFRLWHFYFNFFFCLFSSLIFHVLLHTSPTFLSRDRISKKKLHFNSHTHMDIPQNTHLSDVYFRWISIKTPKFFIYFTFKHTNLYVNCIFLLILIRKVRKMLKGKNHLWKEDEKKKCWCVFFFIFFFSSRWDKTKKYTRPHLRKTTNWLN